jgi:hypothetical protein
MIDEEEKQLFDLCSTVEEMVNSQIVAAKNYVAIVCKTSPELVKYSVLHKGEGMGHFVTANINIAKKLMAATVATYALNLCDLLEDVEKEKNA